MAASYAESGATASRRLDDNLWRGLSAVRRYFLRRVGAADVDDMVQDVALRMEQRATEGQIENLDGYMFQVARSVMLDQQRKAQSRCARQHQSLEEWHHPVEEISPHRIAEGKDELQKVIESLENLPDRTRQAFVLHRFEHLSYGDIATRMGISVSAVEKHIMRAIRKLSATLGHDR